MQLPGVVCEEGGGTEDGDHDEDHDEEDDEVTSQRSEDPLAILTCGVRTPILSLHHRLAPRKSLVILAPLGLTKNRK